MPIQILSSELHNNTQTLSCQVTCGEHSQEHVTTKQWHPKTSTHFQIKITTTPDTQDKTKVKHISFYIKFYKSMVTWIYTIYITSELFGVLTKHLEDDSISWQPISNISFECNIFNIVVHLEMVAVSNPTRAPALHKDIEFTDFELHGDDGSIEVHRSVLATSSPVFKSLLSREWRETMEGRVHIPGTSKEALQQLKDYMYLGTVPDMLTSLKRLILLAEYYNMPDMEQSCAIKLVKMFSADNTLDVLEFIAKRKSKKLTLTLLLSLYKIDTNKMADIVRELLD